jgi:hypothetical protein
VQPASGDQHADGNQRHPDGQVRAALAEPWVWTVSAWTMNTSSRPDRQGRADAAQQEAREHQPRPRVFIQQQVSAE